MIDYLKDPERLEDWRERHTKSVNDAIRANKVARYLNIAALVVFSLTVVVGLVFWVSWLLIAGPVVVLCLLISAERLVQKTDIAKQACQVFVEVHEKHVKGEAE